MSKLQSYEKECCIYYRHWALRELQYELTVTSVLWLSFVEWWPSLILTQMSIILRPILHRAIMRRYFNTPSWTPMQEIWIKHTLPDIVVSYPKLLVWNLGMIPCSCPHKHWWIQVVGVINASGCCLGRICCVRAEESINSSHASAGSPQTLIPLFMHLTQSGRS